MDDENMIEYFLNAINEPKRNYGDDIKTIHVRLLILMNAFSDGQSVFHEFPDREALNKLLIQIEEIRTMAKILDKNTRLEFKLRD